MQVSNVAKTDTVGTEVSEKEALYYELKGIAASSGAVHGRCIVVSSLEDLYRLEDGAIAVAETAAPYLIPFIPMLAGLATERGGIGASALLHAREHGVPAVVGVKELMKRVREGDMIWVDGESGIVYSPES